MSHDLLEAGVPEQKARCGNVIYFLEREQRRSNEKKYSTERSIREQPGAEQRDVTAPMKTSANTPPRTLTTVKYRAMDKESADGEDEDVQDRGHAAARGKKTETKLAVMTRQCSFPT